MTGLKIKEIISALVLSTAVFVLVAAAWQFGAAVLAPLTEITFLQGSPWLSRLDLVWLFLLAAVTALVAERFGARRLSYYALIFLVIWFCLSVLAGKFMRLDLLFIPVLATVAAVILATHLRKLWAIDSDLTKKLVALTSAGHLLEGKSAELRIESGLKLLETVLPLSEAIVFRITRNGDLNPVGRARNDRSPNSPVLRQASWRENIELCEEALRTKETAVKTGENDKQGRIAVPLVYEDQIIGVLFVHIRENFERADQNLLEAFSGQLARNFQRKELRGKSLPHKSWWSSFSTTSAENRLGIISLIQSIFKEQSFSAVASSYLQEAHAIAYLDGTIGYLNRQMRHLAGIGAGDVYKTDLFSLLDRFKTEVFSEPSLAIRRVLQTGEAYRNEIFLEPAGKTLDMQITLVKVPIDDESLHETDVQLKPGCFLITFRDITAAKENEKLRSDTASLMSHELRTPITSIKGFAELMLEDQNLNEDQKEFLSIIAGESQRLSKMLDSYLSVSRLEQADKQEVVKTAVKLDHVVREVIDDYKERARQKRIRLLGQTDVEVPPVAADRGLIARAIGNLIDNAIRYSPERTSVIISTILEADFLRVVVEDRGYGIHSGEHEKIWQKFYRVARDGQDKEEESTGLGLSIVKEVAEQHGGRVELESEVGQGSKFSLMLPRL